MAVLTTDPATTPVRVGRAPLVAALGTVYVAWGSTYLAVRFMVDEMPAVLGSGTRALAAGGVMAVGVAAWGGVRRLRVTRAELAGCALLGLLMPVLGQGVVAIAEDEGAPSGITALLIAAVPLWVACLRAMSGDRPSPRSLAGVLVGFGGVAWLIAGHGVDGGVPIGSLLLVVLASMAWACGSWLHPHLRLPADPFTVVVYEMLIGGALLCATGVARGEQFAAGSYSARAWSAWGFLVLVGSLLGLTAYNWLLRSTSVSVVTTYAYVNPVIAVFLGWLVLHERLTGGTLACAAVVVAGVALVVSGEAHTPTNKEDER